MMSDGHIAPSLLHCMFDSRITTFHMASGPLFACLPLSVNYEIIMNNYCDAF